MHSYFVDANQAFPVVVQHSKDFIDHGMQTMLISLSMNDDTGNFAQSVLEQGATAFFHGLTIQIVTFIFGNILAGLAFRALLDFISNRFNSTGQADEKSAEWKLREQSTAAAVSSKNSQSAARGISWNQWVKLLLCVFIDAVGDSSFLLPGVGEMEDIAWAPISAFLMRKIFQSEMVGNIEFVKEILPFTDAIPLASALWVLETLLPDNGLNKLLGLNKESKKEDK